jgi:transketolase
MDKRSQMENIDFIQNKVHKIKRECLDMCVKAGQGHLTSAFSCAEIVSVLYYAVMRYDVQNPKWEDRDRFIMSKNHGSVITYPILADLGYIAKEKLDTFMKDGGLLGPHSKYTIDGIEFSGGSLGIGIGVATGLAYGAKINHKEWLTFALLGDGECYEGSVWEAAMFAGHSQLKNLIVIVDRNGLAANDFTENIVRLEPFRDKWSAFGWDVLEVDGHNIAALLDVFGNIHSRGFSKPLCIIANTIKGKGISFMINEPFMHGRIPKGQDIDKAYAELASDAGRVNE